MQRLKASESVPINGDPLSLNNRTLTFDSEEAQVMDTRFVNEIVWVSEIIRHGDLTKIEKRSKYITVKITSLRAFRSSLKHLVRTSFEGATAITAAPAGLLSDEDD